LTPSVPLYCTADGVEKLKKKFKSLEHEAEKKKRKERKKEEGKFCVFDHILHEEEEVGRRRKLSRGRDVKECCV
jgi:hypothetical protein